MPILDDNSFAAACYNQNSIVELETALTGAPDKNDMAAWGITAEQWRQGIQDALAAKREAAGSAIGYAKNTDIAQQFLNSCEAIYQWEEVNSDTIRFSYNPTIEVYGVPRGVRFDADSIEHFWSMEA